MIFVFGSNTAGRHGKGAAAFARRYHGAVSGCGEGAQGEAYAIPTKNDQLQTLPLDAIAGSIDRFLDYAQKHPKIAFQVTRIGCGLAGYSDDDIFPLFARRILPNCYLPGIWLRRLTGAGMSVIVAGGRDYGRQPGQVEALYRDLDRLHTKHAQLEIVSGMARGADRLGYQWAKARDMPIACFPADWERLGKSAGFVRNQFMAWYSTHLMAYWDGRSAGTQHMIKTAETAGLARRVRGYSTSGGEGFETQAGQGAVARILPAGAV